MLALGRFPLLPLKHTKDRGFNKTANCTGGSDHPILDTIKIPVNPSLPNARTDLIFIPKLNEATRQ